MRELFHRQMKKKLKKNKPHKDSQKPSKLPWQEIRSSSLVWLRWSSTTSKHKSHRFLRWQMVPLQTKLIIIWDESTRGLAFSANNTILNISIPSLQFRHSSWFPTVGETWHEKVETAEHITEHVSVIAVRCESLNTLTAGQTRMFIFLKSELLADLQWMSSNCYPWPSIVGWSKRRHKYWIVLLHFTHSLKPNSSS